MNLKTLILLFFSLISAVAAQNKLTGSVSEKDHSGKLKPLPGANIYWLGTTTGTSSDEDGSFTVARNSKSNRIIISMMGYKADTLLVTDQEHLHIVLQTEAHKLNDVEVVGKTQSTFSDYLHIENKSVMTDKELCKAACCNLSEAFETNPSIDVSFTDAITGAKQIEMLGLSGMYTQTTVENLPYTRGLLSNIGLSFIPGTWVHAINVSKGIGSVANGFESITGQIDIDMRKPGELNSETVFLNLYGDYDQRLEGNLNYRLRFNDDLSVITLMHASSRNHSVDNNGDLFTDMPMFTSFNIMQRWFYTFSEGWTGQLGFHFFNDEKNGGTTGTGDNQISSYKYNIKSQDFNVYGKVGYVFPEAHYKSFGIQWSLMNYNNSSEFGIKQYKGNEKTAYINFLFQSVIGSEKHKYRTGLSFLFDQINETFQAVDYDKTEKIPGIFLEYTFTPDERFSLNLGLRADQHNYYGRMITPRLHMRYSPQEDWVFRAATGRGFRSSNIFTEYASVLASNRAVNILSAEKFGYGLNQEKAWNYGVNATHYFLWDYRESTISIDLYKTDFEEITIADMDTHPGQINFSSVKDGSYSYSAQAELNIQPFERFETRMAYRYMKVMQKINENMVSRPLTSNNRALLNLAYSTETENDDDPKMAYDMTLQWFSRKRLPSTAGNPEGLRAREYSPSFVVVNTQITRTFNAGLDLYLGIENLLDFRQNDIIIDPLNPNGQYFDASLVWGPVNGRMVYAGLRWRM